MSAQQSNICRMLSCTSWIIFGVCHKLNSLPLGPMQHLPSKKELHAWVVPIPLLYEQSVTRSSSSWTWPRSWISTERKEPLAFQLSMEWSFEEENFWGSLLCEEKEVKRILPFLPGYALPIDNLLYLFISPFYSIYRNHFSLSLSVYLSIYLSIYLSNNQHCRDGRPWTKSPFIRLPFT